MQAAALLFMNRPGHRAAASSISGDSLSSEAVSHSSHDLLLSSRPTPTPNPTASFSSRAAAPLNDSPLLTLNTLDPAERAALIRQSRKLNKVLGATPHIAEAPRPGANPRLHQRRGTISGPEAVRRTLSATSASTSASRGKVSKSLVVSVPDPGKFVTPKAPFLCIATNSNSSTPRWPASPTVRRRLSDSSIASSATSASFAFAPPSPVPGAQQSTNRRLQSRTSQDSIDLPISSVDPPILDSQASLKTIQSIDSSLSLSLASPVFSPRTTEELSNLQRQQTRARMAKLQRLMGENVPSELVLPTAGRPSTSSRRRLSIDLPPIAKDVGRLERPKHKHTKSMWKSKDDTGFESAPEPEDQLRSKRGKKFGDGSYSRSSEDAAGTDVLRPPLTEKQKALNVKRAMKMAQVFGVPPPQGLYQIQSSTTGTLGTRNLSRQSLVSLASLAYLLDHDRDSLYDMLASAPELAEEGEDEGPVEWPYERKGTEDIVQDGTVDPQDKATIENSLRRGASTKSKASSSSGRGSPNISPSPLLGVSRASSHSDVNLAVTPPEHSPTSTSGLTKSGSLRRAKSKERIDGVARLRKEPPPPMPSRTSGPDADFAARRRRANKLSRFFGVGYQDLFNTMLFGIPGSPSGAPNLNTNEEPVVPPLPSSQEALPRKSGGGTVVVVTDDGKEIDLRKSAVDWGAAVDQQDLKAMMGRLRALRA